MILQSRFFCLIFFIGTLLPLSAQKPKQYNAGETKQLLKKLNVLGTVLYVAAHPDDENTSMISYFANGRLYRTAYLSATRGDGGQNLIGPEIREELGLIRTQELLGARRIDGGQQFFSRANDFGYSKNAEETQKIWNREEVLSDFVRVFRKFRPDVVITRFTPTQGGHGHHLTSAILAKEAYKLSGDEHSYPEQLETMDTWSPKKIFWNTSWWFYRREGIEFDTAQFVGVDVGGYNALLGKSYTEISALSRSMHKSQGFGATGSRGSSMEYLKQWEGEQTEDIFGGIDTSWGRVADSEKVAEYLKMAEDNYDPENPEEALRALMLGRRELSVLQDQFWKEIKIKEIDEAIRAVAGIYLEVTANDYSYIPGDSIHLKVESLNRMVDGFVLGEVKFLPFDKTVKLNLELKANQRLNHDFSFSIPKDMSLSQPYWLVEPSSLGMYTVSDKSKIGFPENKPVFNAQFLLKYEGQFLEFQTPVSFKVNDPVKGEFYQPIAITPPIMSTIEEDVIVFADRSSKDIVVKLKSGTTHVKGKLKLNIPKGWSSLPATYDFELNTKNEEQAFTFQLTPSKESVIDFLSSEVTLENNEVWKKGVRSMAYDHFPIQTLFPESKVKIVKLDLKKSGERIGYIEGAGDAIPSNLEQVGYSVDILDNDDVIAENLKQYSAVILGVRAFNTVPWLAYKNKELFKYAEEGGTVIVQYNTSHRLVTTEIAPYPVKLSRDRVTVEEAEVRVLAPKHKAFNQPNKISSKDFDGWVQERGLYFPIEWSEEFVPLLSSNDPEETPKDGGLLVAKYGKGHYVYSGYSWFRELPAGVPGAYRLFVNLISLGSQTPSN